MAIIQTCGLSKRYGGIVAVDDVSFHLRPGKVTALLGPNGAGKTTVLRLMLDLERGGGETLFDGRPYRYLARPATEVGACVGPVAAHPGRRVRAHLRMLAAAGRIPARRVAEVLDLVGLTPVAGARARVLSAGAAGRLALASALLGDPDTLILDEPATGLDPQGLRWLRDFLRAYAAEGRTVLVAGHILAETADCADRVLVMSRGRIVVEESGAEFLRRGVREGVSVRTPQVARLSELVRAEGFEAVRSGGATVTVTGANRARVGEIAFRGGILLHELAEHEPGVGDAFTDVVTRHRESTPAPTEPAVFEPGTTPGTTESAVTESAVTKELVPEQQDGGPRPSSDEHPPERSGRQTRESRREPDPQTVVLAAIAAGAADPRPAPTSTAEAVDTAEQPAREPAPRPDHDAAAVPTQAAEPDTRPDASPTAEVAAPLPPRRPFARTWRPTEQADPTEPATPTEHADHANHPDPDHFEHSRPAEHPRHTTHAEHTDEVRSA
ncbi:ATP-binding cassette domain-containing protein [Streptomyces sp. SID3343]|uniref:ATP-binding cassette domain-containing protein n=1 Tax=Streptomyces sp. SID3343 TaxID=2690260 RepID=UPI0013703BC0|nr:ATP-binding cassette domain-containing protein [Streptomyces sp. SID3343]MYW01666.1 ATP-binding cassette domain-containing protein [Streptomyces sp. SID3343]